MDVELQGGMAGVAVLYARPDYRELRGMRTGRVDVGEAHGLNPNRFNAITDLNTHKCETPPCNCKTE